MIYKIYNIGCSLRLDIKIPQNSWADVIYSVTNSEFYFTVQQLYSLNSKGVQLPQ